MRPRAEVLTMTLREAKAILRALRQERKQQADLMADFLKAMFGAN